MIKEKLNREATEATYEKPKVNCKATYEKPKLKFVSPVFGNSFTTSALIRKK